MLRNLFKALGVNISDILSESDSASQEILGYLATPLTGVVNDTRSEENLISTVSSI